jgi:hypothetical protein
MAMSGSVVPHPVLGFEFVLVSPRLLIRAPPDSAFEALENRCAPAVCYFIVIRLLVPFLEQKMHPKQRACRIIE